MTDNMFCMIDTNVLVYAFEAAETLKHELAGDLVEEMLEGKLKAAVSTQILSELFVNITAEKKKTAVINPLSVQEAKSVLSDVISLAEIAVLEVKAGTVMNALAIKEESNASYWDCLIAATMIEHGITTIYTEDKEFEKIKGLTVMNPFFRV